MNSAFLRIKQESMSIKAKRQKIRKAEKQKDRKSERQFNLQFGFSVYRFNGFSAFRPIGLSDYLTTVLLILPSTVSTTN